MPQAVVALGAVVAAKVGIVSAASAIAFLTSAAATYTVWAVTIASAVAFSAAQRSKLKKASAGAPSSTDLGRTQMVRDPLAPRRIIYGQVLVSGTLTFFHQATSGSYHYMVLTLAAHECEELGEIRIDNEAVTLDGSGNVTSGPYAGYVQIRKYLGSPDGERDTVWESAIGSHWTADHLGKNIARLHIRLLWDANKFPAGLPLITCMVKGAKVYDPRDEDQSPTDPTTWKWSRNCALCTAHYIHVRRKVPYSRIDTEALITAANICDEEISLAPV